MPRKKTSIQSRVVYLYTWDGYLATTLISTIMLIVRIKEFSFCKKTFPFEFENEEEDAVSMSPKWSVNNAKIFDKKISNGMYVTRRNKNLDTSLFWFNFIVLNTTFVRQCPSYWIPSAVQCVQTFIWTRSKLNPIKNSSEKSICVWHDDGVFVADWQWYECVCVSIRNEMTTTAMLTMAVSTIPLNSGNSFNCWKFIWFAFIFILVWNKHFTNQKPF